MSAANAGCDVGACTVPAATTPRTATSGVVWFSTTSTTRPLPSTLCTVRAANGCAGAGSGTLAACGRTAAITGAFGFASTFVAAGAAAGEVVATGVVATGALAARMFVAGTNQPTVARSGTRYVAATRRTSSAPTARMRST